MTQKKSYFEERTEAEIKAIIRREVGQTGLVDSVLELGNNDALLLVGKGLTPLRYNTIGDSRYASRNHLRKGFYIPLAQPLTQIEALRARRPFEIRKDLDRKLKRPEHEIYALGYSYRTLEDGKTIFIPFWSIMEGCMRDSYEQKVCQELPADFRTESKIRTFEQHADKEGAVVFVEVPSSREGLERYEVKFRHVPITSSIDRLIIGWNTTSECATNPHEHNDFQMRDQDQKIVEPQEVHAFHKVVRHYLGQKNKVPFEMCQYAIPSRIAADFYRKLNNNLLVEDQTLIGKNKLRKPRLNELCVLTSRLIGKLGMHETMFWDFARDGLIKDYQWT